MIECIWKYPLNPVGPTMLLLPIDAVVVEVNTQDGNPHLWARVNPFAGSTTRTFVIVGTGWEYEAHEQYYVGTFHAPPFVWHVFERIPA